MLLWAIGGVFTMILIHRLVGYAQFRYGYSLFHSIGTPMFSKRMHQIKSLKKRVCIFYVICVHYSIVLICAYMLFT